MSIRFWDWFNLDEIPDKYYSFFNKLKKTCNSIRKHITNISNHISRYVEVLYIGGEKTSKEIKDGYIYIKPLILRDINRLISRILKEISRGLFRYKNSEICIEIAAEKLKEYLYLRVFNSEDITETVYWAKQKHAKSKPIFQNRVGFNKFTKGLIEYEINNPLVNESNKTGVGILKKVFNHMFTEEKHYLINILKIKLRGKISKIWRIFNKPGWVIGNNPEDIED